MIFRHTKPAASSPLTIRCGVTRAGRVGVAVYRDGRMIGWGLNETAALACATVTG